jgi:hypothetical protein
MTLLTDATDVFAAAESSGQVDGRVQINNANLRAIARHASCSAMQEMKVIADKS